ncbi:hypothetical protein ACFSBG_09380 [Georgenia yuyongxinii]|uniref:hypothetical protein n=1 Tax=Georgenia yuyongxinii TaxID=2589797 RepID=UPI0015D3D135|nr:hypothetical protein [Georgenia yuyongxinii]
MGVAALVLLAGSLVTVPFVTVLLSARLDDEPVTAWLVAGCLLILAGVYVGALRREPAAASSSQPAPR